MRRALLCVLALCWAASAHIAYEGEFLDSVSKQRLESDLKTYTRYPHQTGTANDYDTALWTLQQLQALKLNATQQVLSALLPFPGTADVRTVGGANPFVAKLAEAVIAADPTSDTIFRNLTFGGYTPSGDAQGELVYVNYASVEDFAWLRQNNVVLTGKIGIARYGGIFRGLKARHAQQNGMAGLLVYSDPADDGYTRGPVFPDGPWRPPSGVQRGSYSFLSLCAGDPGLIDREPDICGPGIGPADLMPSIPTHPISYADAQPLLQLITGGPSAPAKWKGGLPVPYAIGPGPVVVSMSVRNHMKILPLWNVLATIPGTHADPAVARQLVIVGNHRDAWVFGAVDPNSGSAVLLEVARGLSLIMAHGWRPARTIVLASWDGEEQGLIGSTYYGETGAKQLKEDAVAYLNVDAAVTGPLFEASASPSLSGFIRDTCRDVSKPAYEAWGRANNRTIGRLGSGSDFTVMLDYLGIASMDLEMAAGYGVYHSIYDSFAWMKLHGDPTFSSHATMTQILGLMTIRLATARVLPFNASDYAAALRTYANEAAAMAADIQGGAVHEHGPMFLYERDTALPVESQHQQLQSQGQGVETEVDVEEHLQKGTIPAELLLGFGVFSKAVRHFAVSAGWLEQQRQDALVAEARAGDPEAPVLTERRLFELNERLRLMERQFLDPQGLPGRPYFKHQLVAPGLDTGYAAEVLPALKQALRDKNLGEAATQLGRLTVLLNRAAEWLAKPLPDPLPNPNDNHGGGLTGRRVLVAVVFAIGTLALAVFAYRWCLRRRQERMRQQYGNLELGSARGPAGGAAGGLPSGTVGSSSTDTDAPPSAVDADPQHEDQIALHGLRHSDDV